MRIWKFLVLALLLFSGVFAYADAMVAVPAPLEPPVWFSSILLWLYSVPKVGPVLLEAGKWFGVAATVLTALTAFLIGIAKALDGISALSPYLGWLGKVSDILNTIIPWFRYFSNFNQPVKPWKDPNSNV